MNRLLWMLVALLSLAACTIRIGRSWYYRRSVLTEWRVWMPPDLPIGNKGYLCGEYRGSKKERLKDSLWEYHIDNDTIGHSVKIARWGYRTECRYRICCRYQRIYIVRVDDKMPMTITDDCWGNTTRRRETETDGGARMYALGFGIGNYGYVRYEV